MLREDLLQQNAFSPIDGYCPMAKQDGILRAILQFYQLASDSLRANRFTIDEIINTPEIEQISRLKEVERERFPTYIQQFLANMPQAFVKEG